MILKLRLCAAACLLVAARSLAAQDSSFTVGTAIAKRGATAYGDIVVPPNSDAGMSMPVTVVNGAKAGKVVAFIAGSHGTEYASIVALSRLAAKIDASKRPSPSWNAS